MDETIRRYLGWTIAVLMTVMAAGSFLFRYAGFMRLLDSVESVSLSDSVVKADEGQSSSCLPSSYPSSALAGGLDSRMALRATREGLVRECGGSDLIGVLMLAEAGVSSDGRILADGAAGGGIAADGVPGGGIAAEGVPGGGIVVDGVSADQVDIGSIKTEDRYRVVYAVDVSGVVASSVYERLP